MILEDSEHQLIKRLCELFPIVTLRQAWPEFTGTKEELCFAIAGQRATDRLLRFIDEYFSCCKQHVYVFTADAQTPLPDALPDGEQVIRDDTHAIHVVRCRYSVVLKNPLSETTLEFLWPVKVERIEGYVVVRFVVLEKNLGSYVDGHYYLSDRSVDEKAILQSAFPLPPADLHRGIKALWDADFMDSTRVGYKKAISTAREEMDEERGIKEFNPELYAVLLDTPLLSSVFQVSENAGTSVTVFTAEPYRGYIGFPRYSDDPGDTDVVIRQILGHN